jgi:hypothetical protein
VTFRNAREVVLACLGHLPPERIHTYATGGLIDTGTLRSVLPRGRTAKEQRDALRTAFGLPYYNGDYADYFRGTP